MRKVVLVILLRLALVVAVFASAALFVEYQRAGDPAFCGAGSGCLAVRMSPYSKLDGVPLPTIGLFAFLGLFFLALRARSRIELQVLTLLATVGGLVACYLLYLQETEIHAFCKWCVAVDASAIVATLASFGLLVALTELDSPASPSLTTLTALTARPAVMLSWIAAALVGVLAPFLWAQFPVVPAPPPEIAALQVPGKVTIVSFTDFECPFCRALHPTLDGLVEKGGGRFALVRVMMPLSGHPGALPAALAYECTPEGKRLAMVDELYTADPELLNRQGLIDLGTTKLGLDKEAFGRCMDAPETLAIVERDKDLFAKLQAQGLPTTYVGPRVILGYNPDRLLEAADLALRGQRPSLPVAWMLAVFAAAALAAVGITAREGARAGRVSR